MRMIQRYKNLVIIIKVYLAVMKGFDTKRLIGNFSNT